MMSETATAPAASASAAITTNEIEIERIYYKQFWSKYAKYCTNEAMMLNSSANEFEEEERHYIISSLPNFNNQFIVDIGAGIGRFTTVFAMSAKHVLSTDFIENFMIKNKQRNAPFKNITYKVVDAVNLQLDHNSVDLVFTNWLLMYLSDNEMIQFVHNVLRWLKPNAFLHLRESCSQPSTARANGTMHNANESNPTTYRLSSQYIRLLKSIRYRQQSDGNLYRFEIHWARSVPTYIMRQKNWRQIHWLTQKVICNDDDDNESSIMNNEKLLRDLNNSWKLEQLKWDNLLNNAHDDDDIEEEYSCWSDQILNYASLISDYSIQQNSTILSYNPRKIAYHLHINAHLIAQVLNCSIVWNIETNEYFYRTSLTKANDLKDIRIQFGWNKNIQSAINYWIHSNILFDAFIASEFFSDADITQQCIHKLKIILRDGAPLLLIEPFNECDFHAEYIKSMLSQFKDVTIEDVTQQCNDAISKYLNKRQLRNEMPEKKVWKLIRGYV